VIGPEIQMSKAFESIKRGLRQAIRHSRRKPVSGNRGQTPKSKTRKNRGQTPIS